MLDTITIPADTSASATGLIVLLHGWGANAMDLANLASSLDLSDYTFVLPNAPLPHPAGEGGRMWYDFQNENQGYYGSRQVLRDWLPTLAQSTQIPLSQTILAGFSQGGAMALDVGLSLPLAGIIALSGYVHPLQEALTPPFPPILMLHGVQDLVVPIALAEDGREQLLALGADLQYQTFHMGHEIRPEVLPLIETFVRQHTPRSQ